ncbi:hypothetical protein [Sphingobacterium detergens]|uniref:Sel1 repeat-containing protein n=1 Tax=Sphingobacterium detergens TaxID=1145106 RepID=A0A420B7S4_SPHD1|nr:hypothetical protein [Sphingobacterium detergens]RKE52840.1 hypothetical protein DFQ12_3086 [Sphingobacterium detergens]
MSIRKLLQLLVILFYLVLMSCNQKSQVGIIDDPRDLELPQKVADSLWRKAINEGDFKAYNEVSTNYWLVLKMPELYYYALLMANRHQCPEAYLNLYEMLIGEGTINGVEVNGKDSISRNQALFYLLKAYELGEEDAVYSVYKEFGDSISLPKSINYLKKIQKFYTN